MTSPNRDVCRFVSLFLSHAGTDKPLVEAVAKALAHRGVLAWLDKNELRLGPLDVALKEAVVAQAGIAIFLSPESVKSEWCKDELNWALEVDEGHDHLLPVFLGDPLELVREHKLLGSRFLHSDGDRVKQLGYRLGSGAPDPVAIAEQLAAAVYRRVIRQQWREAVVVLDQRGQGFPQGRPVLPDNLKRLDAPVLTFRPRLTERDPRETVVGAEWAEVNRAMRWGLSTALGTLRGDPKKLYLVGNAQTSLFWSVGAHFDRTTSVDLFVHGREVVSNKGQLRSAPLSHGNADAARLISGGTKGACPEVALGVGPCDGPQKYSARVRDALLSPSTPLFWIESGDIKDSAQAMKLVADLVASAAHLCSAHQAESLTLFWVTANHVASLAAANLTSHVVRHLRFMEWDHGRGVYEHLPM